MEERRKELFLREFSGASASDPEGAEGGQAVAIPAFEWIKKKYNGEVARLKQETERTGERLHALFSFAEQAFATSDSGSNGNEMLILVTELTVGKSSSAFIATFGSEDYRYHNEELMLSERRSDLKGKIAELGL